jgi:organic radical activating enzyme
MNNITERLNQATHAHHCNLINLAEKLYKSILKEDPFNPIANYGVGSILIKQKNLKGEVFLKNAFKQPHPNFNQSQAIASTIETYIANAYQDHAIKWINYAKKNKIVLPQLNNYKKQTNIPKHIAPSIHDPLLNHTLKRYHPIESSNYIYAIDIVGGCNLRCPTCPVSNQNNMPKGLMDFDLFNQILNKIKKESETHTPEIWLFNWGEPLLHPLIGKFIQSVHHHGFNSFISSNLNIATRIDDVMKANPNKFKISLSSLNQDIYSTTHERGDISTVIKNLHALAKARDTYHATTEIWIGHHIYKNTLEEQDKIQKLAHSLGFDYRASNAIIAPIEKSLRFLQNPKETLNKQLENMLLSSPKEISHELKTHRSGNKDCELRFNMTAILHDGTVGLCCGTTQTIQVNKPTYFLDHTSKELEAFKYTHPFCSNCMKQNLHLTMNDQ